MNVTLLYAELKPSQTAVVRENEDGSYTILINKNKCPERQIQGVLHELAHIINDDFYLDEHVNLVEQMVRMSHIDDAELESINFYHHVL